MVKVTVDIDGFDEFFENEIRHIEKEVGATCKEIATEILTGIHMLTPVDTGEALANFQVSRGQPFAGLIPPPGPETPGASEMRIGTEPNYEAARKISLDSLEATDFSGPDMYWISNNSDHIVPLEYGEASKRRAPMGMVRITVAAVASKRR